MLRVALTGALLLVVAGLCHAQQPLPHFTPDFPPEEFAERRARLYDAIGPDAIALVQGAPAPHSSARFRQSNQFFYLTGVETPHALVLLDGRARRTTLFLPHENPSRAGTDGAVLSADDPDVARTVTGVDAVYGTDVLGDHLARYARSTMKLYLDLSPAEGPAASRDGTLRTVGDIVGDAWDGRAPREGHFAQRLRERFPTFEIHDLTPVLDEMRLIKSPRELRLIRQATQLSAEAILEAMRSTEPGVREHEIDALARFIFFRHGAQGEGYAAIVATGTNAYTPHHRADATVMQDGELVLMDYAPDIEYYRTDITRQWPVNGRWSPEQRQLYGFYLAAYNAILARIRPHVTAGQIMQEAAADMETILAGATFNQPHHRKAAEQFVASYRRASERPNASLGHWVGMSTHDPGEHAGPLQPGMVFTIEPALRVPEEQLYIRLEDLIIVTDDGIEVPSATLVSEMDDIERVMAEPGILQRYPRLTLWEPAD